MFADKLPTPTYGTPGILWASLTLALLTLPVVIVATEEALSAVPRGVREAALACGASKWQTIQRVVLPASLPGILTGVILAMARGAGEVAPLMLVGVVKLAPSLPIDDIAPFIHPERKFMHLGFHIYDLGFQSPDAEAAKPIVYATALLLIVVVVTPQSHRHPDPQPPQETLRREQLLTMTPTLHQPAPISSRWKTSVSTTARSRRFSTSTWPSPSIR